MNTMTYQYRMLAIVDNHGSFIFELKDDKLEIENDQIKTENAAVLSQLVIGAYAEKNATAETVKHYIEEIEEPADEGTKWNVLLSKILFGNDHTDTASQTAPISNVFTYKQCNRCEQNDNCGVFACAIGRCITVGGQTKVAKMEPSSPDNFAGVIQSVNQKKSEYGYYDCVFSCSLFGKAFVETNERFKTMRHTYGNVTVLVNPESFMIEEEDTDQTPFKECLITPYFA